MPILLVDDDPFFRAAVKAILQRAGFQTIEASDGLEAHQIIQETGASIDLLLTDIQMPGMDGFELVHSAIELFPNIAVLFMTGGALRLEYSALSLGSGDAIRMENTASGEPRLRSLPPMTTGLRCTIESASGNIHENGAHGSHW